MSFSDDEAPREPNLSLQTALAAFRGLEWQRDDLWMRIASQYDQILELYNQDDSSMHGILEKLALLCSFHPQCDSACIVWGNNSDTLYLSTDRDDGGEAVASSLRDYLKRLQPYLENKAREPFIDIAYRTCYSKLSKLVHDDIICLIIDTLSHNDLNKELPDSDCLRAYAILMRAALEKFQKLLNPGDVEGNSPKFTEIHDVSIDLLHLVSRGDQYSNLFTSGMFQSVDKNISEPIDGLYKIAQTINNLFNDLDRASVEVRNIVAKSTVYMVHSNGIDPVSSEVLKSDQSIPILEDWIKQNVIKNASPYGSDAVKATLTNGILKSEAESGANNRVDAASALVAFFILHPDISPSDRIATSEPLSHPSYRFLEAANTVVFQKQPFILPACSGNPPAGPWFLPDVGSYTPAIRKSLVDRVLEDLRSRVVTSIQQLLNHRRIQNDAKYMKEFKPKLW
ncbi:hypothetical protein C8Q74DRAFT_190748 [Fomes fomentarius]|nr:hypothetical protein C8Q74DRAFT_190748 [Fomes fomentarius]